MNENKARETQQQFLVKWSVLNLLGWFVGMVFVSLILFNLEYTNKFSALKMILISFPLGASLGMFQWFMLKRLGINFLLWVLVTVLGCGVLVTLYFWINFNSFEFRMKYGISYSIINLGLAITLPVGGAIIGSLQSIVMQKHISRLDLWIRAYIFGLLLPSIITPLSTLVKSFFLNLLYALLYLFNNIDLYFLVDLRWLIFFGFLMIITAIFISILTGSILLKQTNINSITMNANKAPAFPR